VANRTRKRLTKTELKKDPIADNLMKGMDFVQTHLKEMIGAAIAIVIAIVVIQAVISSSRDAESDAMANFITAEILFSQAEQYSMANQPEAAMQALQTSYILASEVYNQHSNRSWGRRAAILSAKAGIVLGRDGEVISRMQDLLSTNLPTHIENGARIHLAIALENRGGVEDLLNAEMHLQALLDNTLPDSRIASEAMANLSRIAYRHGRYPEAREWLESSLAITGDTTSFISYQLARLDILR
jgi:hypothetical protein